MKDRPWFTLVFMLIITAVFTGILSGIYEYTKPVIEMNAELNIKKAHLYAFDIDYPAEGTAEEVDSLYTNKIEVEKADNMNVYVKKDGSGQPKAYGFDFAGGALWGEIEGVLVLSSDLEQVIGIDFTEQNETPGLGGRIGEPEFKEQFRGVKLNHEGSPLTYSSSSGEGQIDAITGATLTSNSVLNILNKEIQNIKTNIGGDKE